MVIDKETRERLDYIFKHFGYACQILKIDEESKELQEALIETYKQPSPQNKEHVLEELADVFVVLNQFKMFFKISDKKLQEQIEFKTRRTIDRIKHGYYNKKE